MPRFPWEGLERDAFEELNARTAYAVIVYDGSMVDLSLYLTNLQYKDNASGKADEITLEIDCRDGFFFSPEKGKDLDVTIMMPNWYENGLTEQYHCGSFVIDDITLKGNPKSMTVKAVSQPAESAFKHVPVTNTWQAVTVRGIAEQILAKYGMGQLIFNAEDVPVESMEQDGKSDSEFMSELCKKNGLCLKVYKSGFVIFDEAMMEGRDSYSYFGGYPENWGMMPDDWTPHEIRPDWTWNSTLQGTYTGAKISYTAGESGEVIEAVVGTEDRLLYLNDKAGDIAEAEKTAREKVNEENKKAVTLSWGPALFDPRLFASYCVDIVNLDARVDGKYYVESVTVSMSSSGLSMDVESRKVFERL